MKTAHRKPPVGLAPGREHEDEPVPGLPELLPEGEHMLWQGSPDWKRLAVRAFHLRKLVVYFGLLIALRLALLVGEGATTGTMALSALWMVLLSGTALGLLAMVAWLSARGTLYTITNRRVVMRIGIVLTLTFNIPYSRITGAALHLEADGIGDLPLSVGAETRIAWLHLWPHVRPWRLAHPEPMLRCVPRATEVARLLSAAWVGHTGHGIASVEGDSARQADTASGMPALAGR